MFSPQPGVKSVKEIFGVLDFSVVTQEIAIGVPRLKVAASIPQQILTSKTASVFLQSAPVVILPWAEGDLLCSSQPNLLSLPGIH